MAVDIGEEGEKWYEAIQRFVSDGLRFLPYRLNATQQLLMAFAFEHGRLQQELLYLNEMVQEARKYVGQEVRRIATATRAPK